MVNKRNQAKESARKNTVWGIRVDGETKTCCQLVAATMGTSVSQFVSFIINCWLEENIDLFGNKKDMDALAVIVRGYYNDQLNLKPTSGVTFPDSDGDAPLDLRTKWSVRGISIETRLRIKAMALNKGIPVGNLIDMMTSKEWEREGKRQASRRLSQKVRKDVSRLLSRYR